MELVNVCNGRVMIPSTNIQESTFFTYQIPHHKNSTDMRGIIGRSMLIQSHSDIRASITTPSGQSRRYSFRILVELLVRSTKSLIIR